MNKRATVFGFCVLAVGLLGDSCPFGGRAGVGFTVDVIQDPDERCIPLDTPSSLGFAPSLPDVVWVADNGIAEILPLDVTVTPPVLSEDVARVVYGPIIPLVVTDDPNPPVVLGPDIDSNGAADGTVDLRHLYFDSNDRLFATISTYESVLPLILPPEQDRPEDIFPVTVESSSETLYPQYPLFPTPGNTSNRTAISTSVCVKVAPLDTDGNLPDDLTQYPHTLDSQKNPIENNCSDTAAASFVTQGTTGVATVPLDPLDGFDDVVARIFVGTRNLSVISGGDRHFPGTVLVYEQFEDSAGRVVLRPDEFTPVIFTSGFNSGGVGVYSVENPRDGPEHYVLVAVAGRAKPVDVPEDEDVIGGGVEAVTDASIDVIDPENPQNGVIATFPLGLVALSPGLEIAGSVAVVGSLADKDLYHVDLSVLDTLFENSAPEQRYNPADPGAVIDLSNTLEGGDGKFSLPDPPGGSDPDLCPGRILGLAFNNSENPDRLYATDFCSGLIFEVVVNGSSFSNGRLFQFFSPLNTEDDNMLRVPGPIAIRPANSSVSQPDAYVLVALPEGFVCGVDLNAN